MLNKPKEQIRLYNKKLVKYIPVAFILLISTFYLSHSKGIEKISDLSWQNYLGAITQVITIGFILSIVISKISYNSKGQDSLQTFSALSLSMLVVATIDFLAISISVVPFGNPKTDMLLIAFIGVYLILELIIVLILQIRSSTIAIDREYEIDYMTNNLKLRVSDVIYFLKEDKLPSKNVEDLYEIITNDKNNDYVYYYLHNSIFFLVQRLDRLLRVKIENEDDKKKLRAEINNINRDIKSEVKAYNDNKLTNLTPKNFELESLYLILLIVRDSIDFDSANLDGLIKALEFNKFELNSMKKTENIYLPQVFDLLTTKTYIESKEFNDLILKIKEEVGDNLKESLSEQILKDIKF